MVHRVKSQPQDALSGRLDNTTLGDMGDLCLLYAVVRTGSFTRAGRRLGLSKSAVSARIASFEKSLGVQLLNRSTRVVTPTDAGRRLAEYADHMLATGNEGLQEIRQESGVPAGLLRVTAPFAIGRQLVAPHVAEFLRLYPDLDLHLELTDSVVSVPSHAYDVAIRHTSTPPETYMIWPLRKVRWFVVASPAYLEERARPELPEDLGAHSCLFYLRDERQTDWLFSKGEQRHPVRVSGRFLANNSEVLRAAVLSGAGIGLLPDYSCSEEIRSGLLVPILEDYHVHGSFADSIVAARPWTSRVPPAVRAIVDYLRRVMGEAAPTP